MNRKRFAWMLALIVMVVFASAWMSSRVFTAQPVKAQQTKEAEKTNAQWEYCAIISPNSDYRVEFGRATATVRVTYFRGTGYQEEKVQGEADKNDVQRARDDAR